MSDSKVRISNPQTLVGELFYIDSIPYTIRDFRWDDGWDSGKFKGFVLATLLHHSSQSTTNVITTTLDIYFYMDTKTGEIKFEYRQSNAPPLIESIFIKNIDDLRGKDTFINLLKSGVNKLIENNSELYKLISTSNNHSGLPF